MPADKRNLHYDGAALEQTMLNDLVQATHATDAIGYVEPDDVCNPTSSQPGSFRSVLDQALTRRQSLVRAASWLGLTTLPLGLSTSNVVASEPLEPTFSELSRGLGKSARVADGYEWDVLLKWGDPIFENAPKFDVANQSVERQSQQFGYNCDYIAFLPLPMVNGVERGLLCVNHEYTNTNLMFPGLKSKADLRQLPKRLVEAEMAAMGHTVVEIHRQAGGNWQVNRAGRFNRRITANTTECRISGPAAGHPRLRTSADPAGLRVMGTCNNCGGGVTPWGTMLICEENFNEVFSGQAKSTAEPQNHKRYGIDGESRFSPAWAKHFKRFNIEDEPNEANRFGWVVEFDPFDPTSVPVKRTALGRMKHEGAGIVTNHDGRVVVYCGDDERFEYVYRFVTRRTYNPKNTAANRNILDDGVLSVARFESDGSVCWLPLTFGVGPLTAKNGFYSQADVLIETRRAADLLGATPMDRPEDVEPSPVSGNVYVILSNNTDRAEHQTDCANPRANNQHGHVLELIPPRTSDGIDHAAERFDWSVFLRCGNPRQSDHAATCHSGVSDNGWVSRPDNAAFDSRGRLWITTDGACETAGTAEGIFVCETDGNGRGRTRLFFQGPRGSELTGVCLTPNDHSLFVSVQHPGEEADSDFQTPSTRWPDFDPKIPPRPSVVMIRHQQQLPIGT